MGQLNSVKMKIWVTLFAGALAMCARDTNGWEDCRDLCRKTSGCEYWQCSHDDNNRCYLKKSSGWEMRDHPENTSGDRDRTVFPKTMLMGGDIPDKECKL